MTHRPIFHVSPDVFRDFPTYLVGCVAAFDINVASGEERVAELLEGAQVRARATFADSDLKDHSQFAAWRAAFSRAGWSASRYPSSVEALHKRVQRGSDLPRINTPVDLANSAVLYYAIPAGAHEITTFGDLPLAVRHATARDNFLTFAGEEDPPEDGEIVYAVGNDVRTRRWVWRQGKIGLISDAATAIFFPLDGFEDSTYDAVVAGANYIAETCRTALKATVVTGLVSRENPTFVV